MHSVPFSEANLPLGWSPQPHRPLRAASCGCARPRTNCPRRGVWAGRWGALEHVVTPPDGPVPTGPMWLQPLSGICTRFLAKRAGPVPESSQTQRLRAHRVYFWQVVLMTDGTQFPFNKVGDRKSQVKSRSLREAAVWVVRSGRGRMWNDRIWENNPKTPLWKWGWVGCPGSWDQKSDLELGPPPLGFLSVGLSKNSPPPRAVSTWK